MATSTFMTASVGSRAVATGLASGTKRRLNSIPKGIAIAFVLCSLFPYVRTSTLPSDLQPHVLIFASAVAVIGFGRNRPPRALAMLLNLHLCALVIFLIGDWNLDTTRSYATYLALFIQSASFYYVFRYVKFDWNWMITRVLILWMCIAAVQQIYDPHFFDVLVAARTSEERGVTSLTPEPNVYAAMCFGIIIFNFISNKLLRASTFLALIQMVLLARAATMIGILGAAILTYVVLISRSPRVIATVVLALGLIVLGGDLLLRDSRAVALATRITGDDPVSEVTSLILEDASVADRLGHIYWSLRGSAENWFIPRGFSAWGPYYLNARVENQDVLGAQFGGTPNRIVSGIGAAVFELGAGALFLLLAIRSALHTAYGSASARQSLVVLVALAATALSGLPLAFPPFALIVGALLARDWLVNSSNLILPLDTHTY